MLALRDLLILKAGFFRIEAGRLYLVSKLKTYPSPSLNEVGMTTEMGIGVFENVFLVLWYFKEVLWRLDTWLKSGVPPPSHKDGLERRRVRSLALLRLPPQRPFAAYLNIHNVFYFSLAEEEIKTEQEVVEGMDISTRSKGE